jgi:protein gp37
MAEGTGIEWCQHSLNLWWGCTKVSEGCKNCYADTHAHRFGKDNWGPKGEREQKAWMKTLRRIVKAAAADPGQRHRVFCQSMADTFEDATTCGGEESENWRTIQQLRIELFAQIVLNPQLDFLVLTKRPAFAAQLLRSLEFWEAVDTELERLGSASRLVFPDDYATGSLLLPNMWLGTSIESQQVMDRMDALLNAPAIIHFVSCEPLLEEVDLTPWLWGSAVECEGCPRDADCECGWKTRKQNGGPSIDWVIAGGESGPKARPMPESAPQGLLKQCRDAGVPFFFKQWGEWFPMGQTLPDGSISCLDRHEKPGLWDSDTLSARLGKKRTGRLLDGVEYSELPEVPHV